MTTCSELADYEWLTRDEASALLDELAADPAPLHLAVSRLRGQLSPTRTHLLMEQVELRRRAAAKFTRASRIFFTRIGLEQATDEWVARYKALRFAQRAGSVSCRAESVSARSESPTIADLCCGIGGDLAALAEQGPAIGVDRDPVAAHFAAVNTGTQVECADATQFELDPAAAWHIDPDRRPGTRHGSRAGRRTTSLEFCAPDRSDIERMLCRAPHAAVKLAPATKVPTPWAERCELEWISRDRECRQLVAWHGDLAQSPGAHSATILNVPQTTVEHIDSAAACGLAIRNITGAPNQPIPITPRPDRYVFDVDPAVLAAGLKGVLAAEHGFAALDAGPTYLTGPRSITDPALACFEVSDVLPLKPAALKAYLREHAVGQLEIKKRGVDIEPEKLRGDLNLRGDHAATLLITRIEHRNIAIIARRVS